MIEVARGWASVPLPPEIVDTRHLRVVTSDGALIVCAPHGVWRYTDDAGWLKVEPQ